MKRDPVALTLCFIEEGDRILLGQKKRGLGVGFWNGFGGHVEPGEAVLAAAAREVEEEAGLVVLDLEQRAELLFTFDDVALGQLEVAVYVAGVYTGVPHETDEMKPWWFHRQALPFERMWADDPYWLPQVLAGECVRGTFHFKDTTTLMRHWVEGVAAF